jgi:hypothetical protein
MNRCLRGGPEKLTAKIGAHRWLMGLGCERARRSEQAKKIPCAETLPAAFHQRSQRPGLGVRS